MTLNIAGSALSFAFCMITPDRLGNMQSDVLHHLSNLGCQQEELGVTRPCLVILYCVLLLSVYRQFL